MEKRTYTTEIPRLSDINRQKRLQRRRERQALDTINGNHSSQVKRFYDSSSWKNLRRTYLMQHPVCELSLIEHKVLDAQHVHHIVKFFVQPTEELQWQLLLDPDNLISLTAITHEYVHYAPKNLTDAQRSLLLQRKNKLFEKYLAQGIALCDEQN